MRSLNAANSRLGWRLGWAGLLVALVGLQGCASIVSGTSQSVSVDTPGCAGARCELSNDKGKYFVPSTPGTVTVSHSYNNLQVTCSREGASGDPLSVASTTKGTVNQRRYDSGTVEVPAYFISGATGEQIGKATHKAMFDLMVRAAADVREALRPRGDGPVSL